MFTYTFSLLAQTHTHTYLSKLLQKCFPLVKEEIVDRVSSFVAFRLALRHTAVAVKAASMMMGHFASTTV